MYREEVNILDELILKNQKFQEDIVELINKSGLPAFIVEPTLKEILEQLNIQKQLQLKKAVENKQKVELKPKPVKEGKK